METKINLKKDNVLKVEIYDENGKDTGNYLEFDLEDVSLPLKIQQVQEEHKKNQNYLKMSFALIDKKQDKSGKKLLSSNTEEKFKVLQTYYQKEIAILDLILGDGGTEKLLNGRKPYYSMFDDIMEYLEPLEDAFRQSFINVTNKIVEKYKVIKEANVLEG